MYSASERRSAYCANHRAWSGSGVDLAIPCGSGESPVRAGAQAVTLSGVKPRVELLRPNSALIDTVVDWHWREWSSDHDADINMWRTGVRNRTNLDRVPFTLVAHLDDEPVGCVSVTDDDLDERFADRGPWLSGMLVIAPPAISAWVERR